MSKLSSFLAGACLLFAAASQAASSCEELGAKPYQTVITGHKVYTSKAFATCSQAQSHAVGDCWAKATGDAECRPLAQCEKSAKGYVAQALYVGTKQEARPLTAVRGDLCTQVGQCRNELLKAGATKRLKEVSTFAKSNGCLKKGEG